MSNDNPSVERVERRLDEHEETHKQFDRRISTNENYRLQAQGALKVIALIIGAGGLTVIAEAVFGIL